MIEHEEWKPVIGFEGRYEVSNLGNVRSLLKETVRTLKPGTGTHGYLYVLLYDSSGVRKVKTVHRIAFESFCGPIPEKMDINHKNGQKKFNKIENLEVMTRSENQLHNYRVLNPSRNRARGIQSGHARFKEKEVIDIRNLKNSGMSYGNIAKVFNCSISAICHIVKRRSWAHI